MLSFDIMIKFDQQILSLHNIWHLGSLTNIYCLTHCPLLQNKHLSNNFMTQLSLYHLLAYPSSLLCFYISKGQTKINFVEGMRSFGMA